MQIRKNHWTPRQFEIPRGTCLFCGEELEARGGRTKEHVIPQWLLEHYDIRGNELHGTWHSATNNFKAKDIRRQVFGSLVQGSVCAECNNGWMCDLEAEVKPLLLNLATNERSVGRLTNAERLLLTRWAVKTSAALNHASNFHKLVRPEHAAAVEDGPPIDGTFVFARQVPKDLRDPISWNQTVGAGPTLKPGDIELPEVLEAFDEGWRIILLIGRLLILTTYFPPGGWFLHPNMAAHTPVWPTGTPMPIQPDKPLLDRDDNLSSELFFFNMELHVVHESLAGDFDWVEIPA